jgi:DNA-directed RNA polymerase subunit L
MSFITDAIQSAVHAGIDKLVSGAPGFIQNMVGGSDAKKNENVKGRRGKGKGEGKGEEESASSSDKDDTAAAAAPGAAASAADAADAGIKPKLPRPRKTKPAAIDASESTSPALAAKLKSKSGSVNAAATTAASAASSCAHINKHAFAKVSGVRVVGAELHFTMSNANVSTANALRRIILSEIPTIVFRTFPHETNRATFHANTSRHHNEILKQRLSCIPIHTGIVDFEFKEYYCEIEVENREEQVIYVTTADFKVKHRGSNEENKDLSKKMFPPDPTTGAYIDFARLMPRVSNYSEGEKLHITADFDIGFAKQDSAFNACCTCAYGCTPDTVKQDEVWEQKVADRQKSKADSASSASGKSGESEDALEVDGRDNWNLLDAQRIVVPNSFDFVVETVGVIKNGELLRKACDIMRFKCEAFIDNIKTAAAASRNIVPADVTIPNAYNIILRNEDYTLGKALEHMLYCKHYLGEQSLVFCAFKKAHPHDEDSYIQVAFETATADTAGSVADIATSAARDVISIFENLKNEHFISL